MKDYFESLAHKYNMPLENIVAIALNRYGVISDELSDKRIRFLLNFNNSERNKFFALGVNTYLQSPFKLDKDTIFLEDKSIGKIISLEQDTCTSTYFRNNKKAITFNSNSRSTCVGCKFCGTYNLTDDDHIDFSTQDKIVNYFERLLDENGISAMNQIESITICTGCFESEDELINHLLLVNDAFKKMGYIGSLNYIGSQLRDFEKIKRLSERIQDLGIYLTIEKFLDRNKYMRPEKASLTLDDAKKLLEYCSSLNITTTFLYILGLEPLETIRYYFDYFKDSINKFPIIQVFQNYTLDQEKYRCDEGKEIEYYIKAREEISKIFANKDFVPKEWECYRSLYFDVNNQERKLVR